MFSKLLADNFRKFFIHNPRRCLNLWIMIV